MLGKFGRRKIKMMKTVSIAVLAGLALSAVASPARGAGVQGVIFTVTLSGALAAGVELSWQLNDYLLLRAGISLMWEEEFVPGAWARAVLLYSINPHARLSFYAGGGLSGFLVLAEEGPAIMALLEAPLGITYALTDRFSLLGELRLGLPWLHPLFGMEIPAPVSPLGLTFGAGYELGG